MKTPKPNPAVPRTLITLAFILAAILPSIVLAQSGDTEFETVWSVLSGWVTGNLGKILAVGGFVVGVGIGWLRQSLMPIAYGIGAAFALAYMPGLISGIFDSAIG